MIDDGEQPPQDTQDVKRVPDEALEAAGLSPAQGYAHPCSIQEFESVYRKEYEQELVSCDRWIKWCDSWEDTHGKNFHQGRRSALLFNNLKMEQLLRVLKQEPPNARSGHNAEVSDRDADSIIKPAAKPGSLH